MELLQESKQIKLNIMQTDYLLQTIINMVKNTSNDAELGAKIRNIITPIVQSQGIQEGKTLLKG